MNELVTGTLDYVRHITAVEAGALIFGILYVVLASRENVLCWPAGIIGSVLALVLASKSNYKLDVVKESYYVLMGFYGWYAWVAGARRAAPDEIESQTKPIISYTVRQITIVIVVGGVLSLIAGFIFDRLNSTLPYLDAATTVFAFITTWLVTQKVLENWLFWIVINAASFYMYLLNGYYAFSTLIMIYLVVSIYGYMNWRREYRALRVES